jgi:hypothetical protein
VTAPAWDVPDGPVDQAPTGFMPSTEQEQVLLDALGTAGVELGFYDKEMIRWVAGWDWPTVAVITSWIARARQATDNQDGQDARPCGCAEDHHLHDCPTRLPTTDADPGDMTDAFYQDQP